LKKSNVVIINNAKCDYCGNEITPENGFFTMSIDFTSYLTIAPQDHIAVQEVTGDTLSKDGDTYSYELCEHCYWSLKEFIQKGLEKQRRRQGGGGGGVRLLDTNNSSFIGSSSAV
jgi:hypothetical protein